MKRFLRYLRVLVLLGTMLALPCGALGQEPLQVTATFFPLYVATLNVAGDVPGVTVSCMAPPSAGCLHDYQMSTAERRVLEDADVVVLNGAGLEGFLDKVLPALDAVIVDASEGIALLSDDEGVNAHVWVSIPGMSAQVHNIAEGLATKDPAHADAYRANAEAYQAKLDDLYARMQAALEPFGGSPIITFHEAFAYFAGDFDLNIVATVHHHGEAAPSAREMAELSTLMEAEGVRALFAEPQYEDTSVDILARETGVPVYLLDPAVSGALEPPNPDAYLETMKRNADVLVEALQ